MKGLGADCHSESREAGKKYQDIRNGKLLGLVFLQDLLTKKRIMNSTGPTPF